MLTLLTLVATPSFAGFVDFDDVTYPCNFIDSSPLSNEYVAENIVFSGTMAPLNQCGNFGVTGFSSPNFLAFSTGAGAQDVQMTFPAPVDSFSMTAASSTLTTLFIASFDSDGNALDTLPLVQPTDTGTTVTLPSPGIAEIQVVVLEGVGILDDFQIGEDPPLDDLTLAERTTDLLAIMDRSWTTLHGTTVQLPSATEVEENLQTILDRLANNGCLLDPVAEQHLGSAYGASEAIGEDGDGDLLNGSLTRVTKSFGGTLSTGENLGTEAGAFSAFNRNRRILALRDDGGFVAGHWVRQRGTNGLLYGVTGTCDDTGDALTALQTWWGSALP